MAEPCALCSKVLKEAYRVCDRFGKPTQIGTVIVSLLDEALCENTPSMHRLPKVQIRSVTPGEAEEEVRRG